MPERASSVLHLVVPGLLERVARWQADYGGVGRFPALEWLFAHGVARTASASGTEETLAALFGLVPPVPYAAVRRLGLSGRKDADGWLCADPVHLEAGVSDLVLTGPQALRLDMNEARELVAGMNEHLAVEGLRIEVGTPDCWHVRLPESVPVPDTPALSQVLGRPIAASLPSGEGARYWHRRVNELQMLLFDAPGNRVRESRGLPAVNSVWVWGGGVLPDGVATPVTRVFGDDPLTAGLARCAGVPLAPVPETAEGVLDAGDCRMVVLNGLLDEVAADDLEAWQAGMDGLERSWFGPLCRALGSVTLKRLVLHSTCGPVFELDSRTRWLRWWRQSRPLPEYAP